MAERQEIEISRLRQIGWDEWDPIGIRALGGDDWQTHAADEYDRYLLHVAGLLQNGKEAGEAVAYLDWIGSEHMDLGPVTSDAHRASEATVGAISAYLKSLGHNPS